MGCLVNVEADNLAISIHIDVQPIYDLDGFRSWAALELDIQAISVWVVMKFRA